MQPRRYVFFPFDGFDVVGHFPSSGVFKTPKQFDICGMRWGSNHSAPLGASMLMERREVPFGVIKHGVLENGLLIIYFLSSLESSIQFGDFPAMFDDTRGLSSCYIALPSLPACWPFPDWTMTCVACGYDSFFRPSGSHAAVLSCQSGWNMRKSCHRSVTSSKLKTAMNIGCIFLAPKIR